MARLEQVMHFFLPLKAIKLYKLRQKSKFGRMIKSNFCKTDQIYRWKVRGW